MYADDTTLSTSLNSLSETTLNDKSTETIINEELCKSIELLNINKLLLNKSKTKYFSINISTSLLFIIKQHCPALEHAHTIHEICIFYGSGLLKEEG